MTAITKGRAVMDLMRDARSNTVSKSSFSRVVRAINTLGLDADERLRVLMYLDYARSDGTIFYEWGKP
jgi:hypothetical protein